MSNELQVRSPAFPTDYAATNLYEDFAESMMMFLTDRQRLKRICPNREMFLHELTKRLGKMMRYR